MNEPITDPQAAVREAGALPMPVGVPHLTAEQRATIAEHIGDAKPASAGLLVQLGQSVRDRLAHDHSTQREDWFCMNLASFIGERMGPVLRRLMNAEARVAELEAEHPVMFRAGLDSIPLGYYTSRSEARKHCETNVRRQEPAGSIRSLSWWTEDVADDYATYELHVTPSQVGELIRGTGYVITPIEVAAKYEAGADE